MSISLVKNNVCEFNAKVSAQQSNHRPRQNEYKKKVLFRFLVFPFRKTNDANDMHKIDPKKKKNELCMEAIYTTIYRF